MTITHITPKEQALQRENERLTDQAKRQSATIHVQAVAIQSMTEEIEGWKADQRENIEITIKQQAEINALKADAERYRAIRNGLEVDPDNSGIVVSLIDDFGGETLSGEAADAAIDNAMKEQS